MLTTLLTVSNFLTPYDVSVLMLVYHYCCDEVDAELPIELLLALITPTLSNQEFNPIFQGNMESCDIFKPVLPSLEDIWLTFSQSGAQKLFVKLVAMLKAVDGLDDLTQLLNLLDNEVLVKKSFYLQDGAKATTYRKVAKSSFIGVYVDRCLTRYAIGSFNEREQLHDNLKFCLKTFCSTEKWNNSNFVLPPYEFHFSVDELASHDENPDFVNYLKNATSKMKIDNVSCVMISPEHFQSILNWEVYSLIKLKNYQPLISEDVISQLMLNDSTRFPSIYIIKYLQALSNYLYQDALDYLHNYFDYMLTQHGESYFHLSLLGMGTFYSYFHNCKPAIDAYKEATKVARECKDSVVLHLIMVWVVDFIENHPEHANYFQVTINQIVKYLKSCSDMEASLIFEVAYRFEGLLKMLNNDSAEQIFQSSLQYSAISLQNVQDKVSMESFVDYQVKVWNYFGSGTLANIHSSMKSTDLNFIEKQIDEALKEEADNKSILRALTKLGSPNLNYEQQMKLKLIEVRHLQSLNDYQSAFTKIHDALKLEFIDSHWSQIFQIEKFNLFLANNVGTQCVPELIKLLKKTKQNGNPYVLSQLISKLLKILIQTGNFDQAKQLFQCNPVSVFAHKNIDAASLQSLVFTDIDAGMVG